MVVGAAAAGANGVRSFVRSRVGVVVRVQAFSMVRFPLVSFEAFTIGFLLLSLLLLPLHCVSSNSHLSVENELGRCDRLKYVKRNKKKPKWKEQNKKEDQREREKKGEKIKTCALPASPSSQRSLNTMTN